MAAKLDGLKRLRDHELEEKQRALAAVMAKVNILEAKRRELAARLKAERQQALEDPSTLGYFNQYQERVRREDQRLVDDIKKLQPFVDAALEAVREAFMGVKQIDILIERHQKRRQAETDRKENMMMDEVGLRGFTRQEDP